MSFKPVELADYTVLVSEEGEVQTVAESSEFVRLGVRLVWHHKPGKLSPWLGNNGYLYVHIQRKPRRVKYLVHRLVALAHVPGKGPGMTVNHIDGNKLNNHFSNLEWVSLAENTRKQWATGLVDLRGEKHPSAKLTNAQTAEIARRAAAGETSGPLSREYGVSDALICKIARGQKRVYMPSCPAPDE